MVNENMVCNEISFGEMAQVALHYAMDPHAAEHDPGRAVATLFKSAGYQKRSYIRNSIPMVKALEDVLMYTQEIPRGPGLTLAQRLAEIPGLTSALSAEVRD